MVEEVREYEMWPKQWELVLNVYVYMVYVKTDTFLCLTYYVLSKMQPERFWGHLGGKKP